MIKKKGENKLSLSSATTCNIRRISEVSVAKPKGMNEYHSRLAQKLSDPSASSKTYWSTLKSFYNGKKITNSSTPTDQIISWNQVLTVSLPQNLLSLLTAIL